MWCRYLANDRAVLLINAVANATMLLRLRMLSDLACSSLLGLTANLLLSVAHVLLMRNAPGPYVHWRTFLVSTARLLRVLVVLSMAHTSVMQPTSWQAMALQLVVLSPASASLLCAVALPLPLRAHLMLQAVVTGIMLTQTGKLCQQLPPGLEATRCDVLQQLSQQVQWLTPFQLKALPLFPDNGLDCCVPVLSAVMVTYGMVLSTLAVYTLELFSRTSYLKSAAQLPAASAAALVRVLRTVWVVGCITSLSMVPIIWEVSVFAQRLGEVGLFEYGLVALGAAVTSFLLQSFMRVWLALVLLLISSMFFVMT